MLREVGTAAHPPRAWGALHLAVQDGSDERLTPTGVGSTCRRRAASRPRAAHPHARGEHCNGRPIVSIVYGSPPRAWGARRIWLEKLVGDGLTPTGVGSTAGPAAGLRGIAAHPHGRGEHSPGSGVGLSLAGSPPRAWGALDHLRWERLRERLTPTGVGSTSPPSPARPASAAHPHGRGEHQPGPVLARKDSGSPPRAWGARPRATWHAPARRLTPTGVGSTQPRPCVGLWPAAHPHGRGEHHTATGEGTDGDGSPPRAWGARPRGASALRGPRLTPTGVGSTAAR